MYVEHRNMETGRLIHIIDTEDDEGITEVKIMLPSGWKIRILDAPEGVDGFDIMTDLGRTIIEPQTSNWTRLLFKGPRQVRADQEPAWMKQYEGLVEGNE